MTWHALIGIVQVSIVGVQVNPELRPGWLLREASLQRLHGAQWVQAGALWGPRDWRGGGCKRRAPEPPGRSEGRMEGRLCFASFVFIFPEGGSRYWTHVLASLLDPSRPPAPTLPTLPKLPKTSHQCLRSRDGLAANGPMPRQPRRPSIKQFLVS